MALVIGGLSLALAFAIAVVVVRGLRRSRKVDNAPRTVEHQNNGSRQVATSFDPKAEEDERFKAQERARHRTEEEARLAAEQETRRRTEEEAHRRANEEARLAAEQETQRRAKEDDRLAAEREAHRNVQEKARLATEQETQRMAEEEARLRAEEEVRLAAAQETQRRAEEEARAATAQKGRQAHEEKQTPTGSIGPATPLRAAREYRPMARLPAEPREPAPASAECESRDRATSLEVRLVFERAGFCRVSLLPRRAAGMPVELAVRGSGDPPELLALQEEWYQDIVLSNLGNLLREGIEWVGSLPEGHQVRLSLSGRELYVLAGHSELYGFVSTPRLILGEEHVVLCVAERLSEVRAAIAQAGSTEPTLLSSGSGVPAGWTGLRGVVPRTPIAPSPTGDILDALRLLADVKIALEGGIRIDRQTWLSGFPPTIRLRGDASAIGTVIIDGRDATVSPDSSYVVPGWDSLGGHSVWCTSESRTYEIRSGAEDWESWDAYNWSAWRSRRQRHAVASGAICGVLVRP